MTVSADSPAGILPRGRRDVFRDDHVTVSAADTAQNNGSRRYRRGKDHVPDRVHHMTNPVLRNRLCQPDTGMRKVRVNLLCRRRKSKKEESAPPVPALLFTYPVNHKT